MRTFAPVTPKPRMDRIDLRTQLESVEAQLKLAATDGEVRRLNALRRSVEKKLGKVQRREEREGLNVAGK